MLPLFIILNGPQGLVSINASLIEKIESEVLMSKVKGTEKRITIIYFQGGHMQKVSQSAQHILVLIGEELVKFKNAGYL